VFTPRKFDPVALGGPGRLWGYLQGGHESADYYLARDGTPTDARVELHGRLFARLGLERLDRRAFERLAAGCHPLTGERLVKTSHAPRRDRTTGELLTRGGAHVPGIDCNLSPPKSVSAALPFAPAAVRAELEAAHLAAVRVTVTELEGRVSACRPTIDGEQIHTPGELGMACFTHHTSRPSPEVASEADRPPDPQLHSHVFVFNLAWCEPRPGQGRFLAVDSRPVFQFGATAEAIYSCELAAQLQRLGYRLDWHPTRKGRSWELAGVDQQVLDLFSSRHRHIEQLAVRFQADKGRPPTKLERRRLAQHDRLAKTPGCRAPHWPAYRHVLDRHGLAPPTPERTLVDAAAPPGEREATVRARLLGPDGLTRQDATFDETTVTKMVFESAMGLLTTDEAAGFLERFLAGPDLAPVVVDGQPRLTTATLLAQEHTIVQAARAKATTTAPAPTGAMIQRVVAEVARQAGYQLTAEQHQVVAYLCTPVGWASLEGWAGTGKTTAVRTVVRAYRNNRQPVVVVSTAADTARRTARELNLGQGYTVEAFCQAVQQGRLRPDARMVVIVEEACMVDTARMHRLLQAAGPAIIRTLGDPEQAQAVGAAGWHAAVDQAIGGHAELTTVVRQKNHEDREVCRLIRQGDAPEALANLNARGRVHLCTNPSVAVKEVVYAWDCHRRERGLDGVKIVTDTSNATIDTLNSLCQARRLRAGELSWPSVELVDRQAGRHERVYVGDRVRLVRSYHAEDGERVANGTAGTVLDADVDRGRVTVACEDGRQVPVRLVGREWAQPLRLGYAGHALRLQGGQAQVVLVLPGSWQTSRQSAYSMATRCVEELHVFVDRDSQCTGEYAQHEPLAALAQRWTRDARKRAASAQVDRLAGNPDDIMSGVDVWSPVERRATTNGMHDWTQDIAVSAGDTPKPGWPPPCTLGPPGDAWRRPAAPEFGGARWPVVQPNHDEMPLPGAVRPDQPAMEHALAWELDL
jgi:conjugative relaxase-like TrwC/TraI family protein